VAYRAATKYDREVMLAAVSTGLIPDTMPARSQFMNEVKRDINAARVKVLAATSALQQVAVAASSVKSTDKPRHPATVHREGQKPSDGTKPKVTSERIKPYSQPVAAQSVAAQIAAVQAAAVAAASLTSATAPTQYPSFWARGRRAAGPAGAGAHHRAATITAAAGVSAQRTTQAHQPAVNGQRVHAAGNTTRFIQAERQRQADQIVSAQRNRAGHHDPHTLIAAAGDNAKRLADAQRADLERQARERAARSYAG
jgi:hypothetical protein